MYTHSFPPTVLYCNYVCSRCSQLVLALVRVLPNPPVNVLSVIENVLAFHDKVLLAHFVEHDITSQVSGDIIMLYCLSAVLYTHLYTNTHNTHTHTHTYVHTQREHYHKKVKTWLLYWNWRREWFYREILQYLCVCLCSFCLWMCVSLSLSVCVCVCVWGYNIHLASCITHIPGIRLAPDGDLVFGGVDSWGVATTAWQHIQ